MNVVNGRYIGDSPIGIKPLAGSCFQSTLNIYNDAFARTLAGALYQSPPWVTNIGGRCEILR